VVVAGQDQVSSLVAGETIILSLQTGMYYGLNSVGARIWALVRTPIRVGDICETVLKEYDVGEDRCQYDVVSVLRQLAAQGLVEISDAMDQ
jgi:hypothetical protein